MQTAFKDRGRRTRRLLRAACAGLVLAGVSAGQAWADYPDRPTRIVSPFSPGGGLDIVARVIAPKLSEALKQPVIVENKTGANGLIAIEYVSKAPPDGYTLLIDTLGVSIHPATVKNLPYDPIKGLEPVAHLLDLPFVLVVSPNVEAKTTSDLVAYARRYPGKLNYAQGGMSNRMLGEMFRLMTNTEVTFVQYKGSGPATLAVLSGESDLIITDIITAAGYISSGRMRALAQTGPKRSTQLPNIPTLQETGVPGYGVVAWYSIFAPGGTPAPVVKRLNAELNKAVMLPDVTARFATLGADPVNSTPEAFSRYFHAELARWKDVAARAKIPVE